MMAQLQLCHFRIASFCSLFLTFCSSDQSLLLFKFKIFVQKLVYSYKEALVQIALSQLYCKTRSSLSLYLLYISLHYAGIVIDCVAQQDATVGGFLFPLGYSWEVSISVHCVHVLCCIAALHVLVSVVAIASQLHSQPVTYYKLLIVITHP